MMLRLADDLDVSYLDITHDLAVARYLCHRIAVMYLGKIVEIAPTETLLSDPRHLSTRALLSAEPVPDPTVSRPEVDVRGGVSKPVSPAPTCRSLDRCPWADGYCEANEHPPLERVGEDHYAACYHAE
jgi:oligopeptide/dipeptide ABC transporter ATP-binding protein